MAATNSERVFLGHVMHLRKVGRVGKQQSVLQGVPDTNKYNTKINVQYTEININTNYEYIKTIE